jgi:hypothetical protein
VTDARNPLPRNTCTVELQLVIATWSKPPVGKKIGKAPTFIRKQMK